MEGSHQYAVLVTSRSLTAAVDLVVHFPETFSYLKILPSLSHSYSPHSSYKLGKSSELLWYFLHPANWITIRDVIRGGSFYFVFSVQSFIRT